MTMKNKRRLRSLLKYLVPTRFLVLIMFPLVWMPLISSKGSQGEIYTFPVRYIPSPVSVVNCVAMLWRGNFDRHMLDSFFSSAAAATCAVFIAILVSYVTGRFHFRFKSVLLLLFLATQTIPMLVMLTLLYQLLAKAKILDDLYSLAMFYTNVTIPFSAATLCGLFDNAPKSLKEAVWVDKRGYFRALFKVVMSVVIPDVAATFIFAFINSWNELFMVVTFVDVDKFKTIPTGFNGLILKYDIKWGEMVAGTVMSLVPTTCLFAFAQKYMVEGLTAGLVRDQACYPAQEVAGAGGQIFILPAGPSGKIRTQMTQARVRRKRMNTLFELKQVECLTADLDQLRRPVRIPISCYKRMEGKESDSPQCSTQD